MEDTGKEAEDNRCDKMIKLSEILNEIQHDLSKTKIVDDSGNPLVVYRSQENERKHSEGCKTLMRLVISCIFIHFIIIISFICSKYVRIKQFNIGAYGY